jgi:drug/metabolite transporter (DMT)-like permease
MVPLPARSPADTLKIVLAYCICFITWGSTWAVAKVGLEDLPPLRLVGIRMLVAGGVLLPFIRSQLKGLKAGTFWSLVGVGTLQIGFPFAMMFIGQQWVPSSWAALLFSTYPVWVLLMGRALLPDQLLTPRKLLAAALGLVGVVALQNTQLSGLKLSSLGITGCLLILGSAGFCALANVLVKRHLGHVPPHLLVCVQTLSSAVPLLGASFLLESGMPVHWTPRAVLALLWLALGGTVVTYQLFYWLLPRISLSSVGAMALLDTLVAVVLGVGLLHEPLTASLILGGMFILSAAALANLSPKGATPAAPKSSTLTGSQE